MKNCINGFVFSIVVLFAATINAKTSEDYASMSWDQLKGEQAKLLVNYVAASVSMGSAQADLAEALGLKEEAEKLRAEVKALKSNSAAGKEEFKSFTKLSKGTNKKFQKAAKKNQELTADKKEDFAYGVGKYLVSAHQTTELVKKYTPLMQGLTMKTKEEAGGTFSKLKQGDLDSLEGKEVNAAAGFAVGVYIGASSPKLATDHVKTSKSIYDYSVKNGVKVPDDATKALSKMDDFKPENGSKMKGLF